MITDTIKYWCDRVEMINTLKKTQFSEFEQMCMSADDRKACALLIKRALEDCEHILVQLLEIFFYEQNLILKLESKLMAANDKIQTPEK